MVLEKLLRRESKRNASNKGLLLEIKNLDKLQEIVKKEADVKVTEHSHGEERTYGGKIQNIVPQGIYLSIKRDNLSPTQILLFWNNESSVGDVSYITKIFSEGEEVYSFNQ